MAIVVDAVDKKILNLLSQNPETSQNELSRSLGISQPAVSARLHKLREAGVLAHLVGVDTKSAQLFLAKIDVATTNTKGVLDFLERCPLYLNGFLTSGRFNVTILLMGENIRSIMSCVDAHIRTSPLIKDMEFNLIVVPVRTFVVPIRPILDKKENTPCGTDCRECSFLANNRCLACPAHSDYRGILL